MNRADVQGLVFSGYAARPVSRVFLLKFDDGDAYAWLRRLIPGISRASEAKTPGSVQRNIAFTAGGLARLRLDEATLAQFSSEFREGMAHPARSELLGDVGEDAPSSWEFGAPGDATDAVLFLYAADESSLLAEEEALRRSLTRFGVGTRVLATYLPNDGREHFGFRMGVSEPGLTRGEQRRGRERVPLGEFLLGHRNAYGDVAPFPTAPTVRSTRELGLRLGQRRVDFGKNGTYLVLRKLEQRVSTFFRYLETIGLDRARVAAARMVGRWPNGAPLVLHPAEPPNGAPWHEQPFGYRGDAAGSRCPLGAHARRANPRDELGAGARAHRLLRRGRLYGPAFSPSVAREGAGDEAERGLVFVALNADLSRQFETVQGSFLVGRGGFGPAGERDPLLGPGAPEPRSFSIDGVTRVDELPRFVRLRGGLYAFLPSISALNYLVELAPKRSSSGPPTEP